jgi:Protein of unknown function (DUF2997)
LNKIIELIVSPNGETRVETKGFTGNFCRAASNFLEQALGTPHSETLKAEFHQTTATEQSLKNAAS